MGNINYDYSYSSAVSYSMQGTRREAERLADEECLDIVYDNGFGYYRLASKAYATIYELDVDNGRVIRKVNPRKYILKRTGGRLTKKKVKNVVKLLNQGKINFSELFL